MTRPASQAGIALIEAVVAITIVSIAAVTILSQISLANVQSGRGITQAESAALAAAYLTEIVARPFDDPDGVDGEVQRRFFDDLDDYNGLNDSGARDASGGVIPGANRFNIRVTVTASNLLPGVPAADTRLISVSVTDPVGATTTATGLRLRP